MRNYQRLFVLGSLVASLLGCSKEETSSRQQANITGEKPATYVTDSSIVGIVKGESILGSTPPSYYAFTLIIENQLIKLYENSQGDNAIQMDAIINPGDTVEVRLKLNPIPNPRYFNEGTYVISLYDILTVNGMKIRRQ